MAEVASVGGFVKEYQVTVDPHRLATYGIPLERLSQVIRESNRDVGGRVVERPWAVDGLLGVHPVVVATLAAAHRVTDGHRGGRYLAAVDALLQHPETLDLTSSAT